MNIASENGITLVMYTNHCIGGIRRKYGTDFRYNIDLDEYLKHYDGLIEVENSIMDEIVYNLSDDKIRRKMIENLEEEGKNNELGNC